MQAKKNSTRLIDTAHNTRKTFSRKLTTRSHFAAARFLRVFLINPALHSSTSSQTNSKHTMTLLDHSRAQERDAAKEAHRNDEKHGLLITKKDKRPKIVKKLTKQLGRVPTADEIAKAKNARKQEKKDKAFFLALLSG